MRKQWLSPRGGSMVWVAVFMLAIPPMILALVNSVRLVQTVHVMRNAVNTACLSGVQKADLPRYREHGDPLVVEETVKRIGGSWWRLATKNIYYGGVVFSPSFDVEVAVAEDGRGVNVTCTGKAEYRVWGVRAAVPLQYETTVEALFNPVPEQP